MEILYIMTRSGWVGVEHISACDSVGSGWVVASRPDGLVTGGGGSCLLAPARARRACVCVDTVRVDEWCGCGLAGGWMDGWVWLVGFGVSCLGCRCRMSDMASNFPRHHATSSPLAD